MNQEGASLRREYAGLERLIGTPMVSAETSLDISQYRAFQGCGHSRGKSPLVTSPECHYFVTRLDLA
jgi:hypothetical protein